MSEEKEEEAVMVAVSKHSSSLSAVKWAIANKLDPRGERVLKLVHVRPPVSFIPSPTGNLVPVDQLNPEIVAAYKKDIRLQTDQELQPHLSLCNARQVRAEFVIVESDEIAPAILEQVGRLNVKSLIIGTSTGNMILRKLKGHSIPEYISRNASEHCSVYVVSKGKVVSVKEAKLSSTSGIDMSCNSDTNEKENRANNTLANSDDNTPAGRSPEGLQWLNPKLLDQGGRDFKSQSLAFQRARAASVINLKRGESDIQSFSVAQLSFRSSLDQTTLINEAENASGAASNSFIDFRVDSFQKLCIDDQHSCGTSKHMENYISTKLDDNKKTLDLGVCEASDTHFPDRLKCEQQSVELATEINNVSQCISKDQDIAEAPSDLQCETSIQYEDLIDLEKMKHELEIAQQRAIEAERAIALATQKAKELDAFAKNEAKKRQQALLLAQLSQKEAAEEAKRHDEVLMALQAAKLAAEEEAAKRKEAEVRANNEALNRKEALAALQIARTKYREYGYEELNHATDGFSDTNLIGLGGYGSVFKGKLHHTTVAIKVLKQDSVQGPKEFQQEIELLSRMHHPHLVLLLGACPEKGCLVYEYLANGSLEDRLACKGGTPPLAWHTRFRIATEVATTLLFLHSAKPDPYVHRDLKPANILLDRNMISKLGDVGLARLVPINVTDSSTQFRDTNPVGTYSYIDPEYQRTGVFTPKSDVYAFGIVILQLLTGKGPIGLTACIENAIEKNILGEMLDPMAGNWPIDVATEMARLALKCSELKRRDRPDLNTILPKLDKLRTFVDNYLVQVVWNKKTVSEGERGIIPSFFLCPLSKVMMEDPYIAADGYTYEHRKIKQWLQDHKTSPMTNEKLKHKQLTPNHSLRFAIEEWKQQQVAADSA